MSPFYLRKRKRVKSFLWPHEFLTTPKQGEGETYFLWYFGVGSNCKDQVQWNGHVMDRESVCPTRESQPHSYVPPDDYLPYTRLICQVQHLPTSTITLPRGSSSGPDKSKYLFIFVQWGQHWQPICPHLKEKHDGDDGDVCKKTAGPIIYFHSNDKSCNFLKRVILKF